jgi:dipeptidyl aminopeptidase/acylaminoacyl peptidase
MRLTCLPSTGVLLVSSCGVLSSFAAEPTSILTPERVAELRSVTEVAVSPDGRHVAFTRSVPRRPGIDDDGEAWSELWVWDSGETNERPFVTGKVNIQSIAWTPNGRQIAFLAKRGDDKFKSIHTIPVDGGEARRAFTLASDISGFSVAPDGERVAVLASDPENEAQKKLKEKGFKQEIYEEDWQYTRLWIGRLFDTGSSNAVSVPLSGSVRQVQWSPTEERLAIAITPTPSVDDSFVRQQVMIVDATTNGTIRARVDHAGKLGALVWSPDGVQLAMIGAEDLHDPSAGRLLVVPTTGGRARDVLPGFEGEITHVAWAGADELVYVASKGVVSLVGRVLTSGQATGVTNLVAPGKPILAAFSLSRDGQTAAFAAHAAEHPAELFTISAGEQGLVRRTDSNPWLAGMRMARQEAIRYRARDGLDIEGVLIRPLESRDGTRYPLILAVHGGPESHVSDGWLTSYSLPGQVAAARGFAVFYPNYRGSTGRGVAFSKLGQGDPAGREFDDLVDAVDHLVTIGLVDRQKVGITGGSYGGYATAWCSTRYSDRFAAGVMFVGISDKVSKVGTTDIPDEEFYVHSLKRPWESWTFLLERSPIFHAGNSRTPMLILHGADDPRVNPGQSRELYRHLKLRSQAPVRLVLYPGEGHGNRKAAARFDYHRRMLRWFEHYLKGPGGAMPPYDADEAL